jgi:capsular polysaccharide biosynthesis protein
MSEQVLDLKRSMHIVRRYWIAVAAVAVVGILAGAAYTTVKPPMFVSNTPVVLPTSTHDVSTQVVVAGSEPVMALALRDPRLGVTFQTLRNRVLVKELTPNILSVIASGTTAAQAELTANVVAASYVSYVGASNSTGVKVAATILQSATTATRTSLPIRIAATSGLGAVLGALVGGIAVLALNRGDRRLRRRDEIADTIGAPVLASLPVWHPKDPAGWAKLLDNYEPNVVHAWRMRNALDYLGLSDAISARVNREGGYSLTVLSLSSDQRALALGPQLAVVAASQGIPTALVVGPQQDANAAATLRAACAAGPSSARRSGKLRVAVADHGSMAQLPHGTLTIVVAVVDGRAPRMAEMMQTTATVLGISAGIATAEQLARVASNAAAGGRHIAGVLIADPDPTDHSTGRLPQMARPTHRGTPTRVTSMTTETTR